MIRTIKWLNLLRKSYEPGEEKTVTVYQARRLKLITHSYPPYMLLVNNS